MANPPHTKRAYRQFCPTARSLDVVGDRWTLLIVRDLLLGPHRYSDLRRSLTGMASNLLAQRLAEMGDAGLVAKEQHGAARPRTVYVLTPRGRELASVVLALARFGLPYLDAPTDEEPLIPARVPLAIVALLHPAEAPERALRIRYHLDEGDHVVDIAAQGPPGARRTLRERTTVAPTTDEPPPVDVTVRGSLAGLLWVRQGLLSGADAATQGLVILEGDPDAAAAVRLLHRL